MKKVEENQRLSLFMNIFHRSTYDASKMINLFRIKSVMLTLLKQLSSKIYQFNYMCI